MQSAKDSFYMALRQRLAALNPMRVVTLDGQQQPAVIVVDNEAAIAAGLPDDCFCLSFGAAQVAAGFQRATKPLMLAECVISYSSRGTAADRSDRGRVLGALDSELLQMCMPPSTPKLDYAQQPPLALASNVFWLAPELQDVEDARGRIQRTATLKLFFVPEVNA